jgi:hypothetical protein
MTGMRIEGGFSRGNGETLACPDGDRPAKHDDAILIQLRPEVLMATIEIVPG